MEEKFCESTPSYGFIRREYNRFNNINLFTGKSYLFAMLKSIKLWYGTIGEKDDLLLIEKAILGLECKYQILDGKTVKSIRYVGVLKSNDIETKELELDKGDFFTKFSICYDDIITYLRFESIKGKVIELGERSENLLKNIQFNEENGPHIIQILYGFYDNKGLRALGFKHVPKVKMFILNLINILRFRHKIKTDINEKDYWSDEKNLEKLDVGMKAIVKLVFLPDSPFSVVFKFCLG